MFLWLFRIGGLLRKLWHLFTSTKLGAWLVAGFVLHVGAILVKLLKFTGVAIVSSQVAAPALLNYIIAPLLSLPPMWQQFLAMMKVDEALGILVAAVALRASEKIAMKPKQYGVEV